MIKKSKTDATSIAKDLEIYHLRIEEKFIDINEKLDRIEVQTTKTNGTVRDLQSWRDTSKGAITIISAVVLPVLLYLLYIHIPK